MSMVHDDSAEQEQSVFQYGEPAFFNPRCPFAVLKIIGIHLTGKVLFFTQCQQEYPQQNQGQSESFRFDVLFPEPDDSDKKRKQTIAPPHQRDYGYIGSRQTQGVKIQIVGHDQQNPRRRNRPAPLEGMFIAETPCPDAVGQPQNPDHIHRKPELNGVARQLQHSEKIFVVQFMVSFRLY